MRYAEFAPAPDLRPFVERYWSLAGPAGGGPILPDGHAELVLHFGQRPLHRGTRQGGVLLVGQMRRATILEIDAPLDAWGIRFHPHTARAVTGSAGQSIEEWPDGDELREMLGNSTDGIARVAITDGWLRRRICGRTTSPVAEIAVRLLRRRSVEATAASIGCSRRHLERVFAQEVGLAPKPWARIVRLQSALRVRRQYPSWTWAAVAAEAGYADQAHLALDFREIAGASPSRAEAAVLSHSSKPETGGKG
jgi:AraC-like DNA-binding protein